MRFIKFTALLSASALLISASANAQEVIIKDNITGLAEAATNSLNNQTAGAGGRQILLTQHTISQKTQITKFRLLSSSTAAPAANGFSYSVRRLNTPFAEIFSGTATRTGQTTYTDVTLTGNNTNLDEFQITGLVLDPGTYYFTVHASDGNAYQVAAHSASAGGVEPLLAENGGVPFLAGANFHLYTTLFGIFMTGSEESEQVKRASTNFLARRADQVTANLPVIANRLFNRGGNGFSGAQSSAFGSSPSANSFAYSANLGGLANAMPVVNMGADDKNQANLGSQPASSSANPNDRVLSVWVEGGFSTQEAGASDSNHNQIYAGIDWRMNPDMVVGLFGQIDTSEEKNAVSGTNVDGNGWMAGPYVAARINDAFIFDSMVAIGGSETKIVNGSVTGSFDAQRLYAKVQATGDFQFGGLDLAPHVALHYFEEDRSSFTDSSGAFVAGDRVSLGRLSFGTAISHEFSLADGSSIIPKIGLTGLWDFNQTDTVSTSNGSASGTDDFRLRLDGSLSMQMASNARLDGGLYYDGIGTDDMSAYGGKLSLSIPLN